MENRKQYAPAKAEIIEIDTADVITSSIGRDEGENDGEWTPYGMSSSDSVGNWN